MAHFRLFTLARNARVFRILYKLAKPFRWSHSVYQGSCSRYAVDVSDAGIGNDNIMKCNDDRTPGAFTPHDRIAGKICE